MPIATNSGRGTGLPQGSEYRHWSKNFIKEHVGIDSGLSEYICTDPDYQVNAGMLALYEFHAEPLLGKFKSVIIDRQYGIVLSRRSSRSLIDELIKNQLLGGLTFQKALARRLNFESRYVLATGRLAYFSTHGYMTGDTDWLSLHHMVGYRASGQRTLHFKTVAIEGISYTFSFFNCGRYILKKVGDSLYHNYVLYKLGQVHLEQTLGWKISHKHSGTLLDKEEYFLPHQADTFTIKDVLQDLFEHKYIQYGKRMADLFELQLVEEDHYFVCREAKRGDSLF